MQCIEAMIDLIPFPSVWVSDVALENASLPLRVNNAWRTFFRESTAEISLNTLQHMPWKNPRSVHEWIHSRCSATSEEYFETTLVFGYEERRVVLRSKGYQADLSGCLVILDECESFANLREENVLLQEQLSVYKEMVESASDALILVEDGKFIEVNPAACRLYGQPREVLLSKHPEDLSPEFQPNKVRSRDLANTYMKAAIRGEPQHFKWQHLRNGVPFTADISLNAARYIRIPGQESKPRFVTILRDVTEKDKVAQSLAESELRFRQLFDFAPVAMCLWDSAGQVVDVNRSWLDILGYSIEDMQQQAQWWQQVFPDKAYAEYVKQDWRDMYAALVASGNRSEAARELAHEVLVNCADGRQRYVIVMPAIVGQYTVLSLYDMTEQRAANMKLKQLNAHLEERVQERTRQLQNALDSLKSAQNELVRSEKLAALGALVAGVSHELNTPIGNAVIMSDTLSSLSKSFVDEISKGLRKSTLDKFIHNMEQAVQIINRNLHKASELILSFKQVAVDQSSYQRRSFLINDVFHELTLMLTPTLKKKGVTLIQHVEGRVLMDSYPGPLTQVLINLVNNAVVHAFAEKSSAVSPQIEVNATLIAKDEVEISVADNGFGMDEAIVDKIFDPFFTTKLGKGGSGLGLHICYTLVNDLLSGSIKVESIQGKGTVFRLRLPLTAPNVTVNE